MGRSCSCCLPTQSSSSSSSRDDSFHICVLGQVVDVGPLRSEKTVVIQAAWIHSSIMDLDTDQILCDDDDGVQQITLTLSYNYSTEVMSYSYIYSCSVGSPRGGDQSGSGTYSIKPPLDTTIECHTEKLDYGGGYGSVWPFITCNDSIKNEDCVPVGGCQSLLTHLCLKQIRDETMCAGKGVADYPWSDPSWQDTFQYALHPNTGYGWTFGPWNIWEWESWGLNQTGCGGCNTDPWCGNGNANGTGQVGMGNGFFNWFTAVDWENDKFLNIKRVVYNFLTEGVPGSLAIPYGVWWGTDVKMALDVPGCYEDMQVVGCCPGDERCYDEDGNCPDCRFGQTAVPMREQCKCYHWHHHGNIYGCFPPCLGEETCGHAESGDPDYDTCPTYGCGLIDVAELFYTKMSDGYDVFRIDVSAKVFFTEWKYGMHKYTGGNLNPRVDDNIYFEDCMKTAPPWGLYPFNSEGALTSCTYASWNGKIECFDPSNNRIIRSRTQNSQGNQCGGSANNCPSQCRAGCSAWDWDNLNAWGFGPTGPFVINIYPPLYGRYASCCADPIGGGSGYNPLPDETQNPMECSADNLPGGCVDESLIRYEHICDFGRIRLGTPHQWNGIDDSLAADVDAMLDESYDYTLYGNSEYTSGGVAQSVTLPYDTLKSSACVEGWMEYYMDIYENIWGGASVRPAYPSIFGITPQGPMAWVCVAGDNAEAGLWLNYNVANYFQCPYFYNPWKYLRCYNSFLLSWATTDSSDAICGGGGGGTSGPGGGDPLEIETWDDSPQNFTWTRFEPHTETDSVTGGTKPYEASLASGLLPSGLSVSISNGGTLSISGTTQADAGAYLCTIQVVDQGGNIEITDQITIAVQNSSGGGTLTFRKWYRSRFLGTAIANQMFSRLDQVDGGEAPYQKVEVIPSSASPPATDGLPPGLSVFINDAGTVAILGIPSINGLYLFKLRATDNAGNTATSGTLSIEVTGGVDGGPGGGPGDPDPNDPLGIIAPGEVVNYPGPTLLFPPTGSPESSGIRYALTSYPTGISVTGVPNMNYLPSGLYLNEVTGAVTGIFPSGKAPCSVEIQIVPSGSLFPYWKNPMVPTASGRPVTKYARASFGLDFNIRSRILSPSGTIVAALGDSTSVWNSGDIEEGDFLLSIIADANGVPIVNLSSGWNMIVANSGFESAHLPLRGSGRSYPYFLRPAISGIITPTGLYPSSYAVSILYKVAGTGDAAYGTAHSQTVGAGLISSMGLRKPSGVPPFGGSANITYFDSSQTNFEIDTNKPQPINSGIQFTSGSVPLATGNRHSLFLPDVSRTAGGRYLAYGNPPESQMGSSVPNSGSTGIYIWWAKSTTDFQTNGPSGVTSPQFTLNRNGKSAGNFPGFTNPLSMMIAVSQYSYNRPLPVSPIAGSPTGCNVLALEIS